MSFTAEAAPTKAVTLERPKDTEELQLEDAVFGDVLGFHSKFASASNELERYFVSGDEDEEANEGEEGELKGLTDDALFFIDEGQPSGAATADGADAAESEAGPGTVMPANYATADNQLKPAWEDSDDERISISLASQPRLRKLRIREGEDVVSGTEYVRRLRWQFERLNPRPKWAEYREKEKKRSRKEPRALGEEAGSSESEVDSDSDSDSGSDTDISAPSSKALSRLLQSSSLVRATNSRKRRKIGPEVVDIQRMKGIFADGSNAPGAITNLSFHPRLPILLASGPHGTAYLHHINGAPHTPSPHPSLVSLHIKGVSLTSTHFFPPISNPTDSSESLDDRDQGRILLSGRRKYFHVWNMTTGEVSRVTRVQGHELEQRSMEHAVPSPCGRYLALRGSSRKGRSGLVNILDAMTLQWHSQVRIDSIHGVRDFAWWANGSGLVVLGANGELTEWNVERRCAVAIWRDEGAFGASVVRLSGPSRPRSKKGKSKAAESPMDRLGGDRWIAVGSNTGFVNIYDRREWLSAPNQGSAESDEDDVMLDPTEIPGVSIPRTPKPLKTIDNLATSITHMAFSPPDDGGAQILAIASHSKRDAFRLVHLPTATVYRNWPTSDTPLGRVSAVAFGLVPADGDMEKPKGGNVEENLVLAVANDRGRVNMWEIR